MKLLLAYARERLTPGRVLPAVLLVVAATFAGGGWPGQAGAARIVVLALALVITFRIYDDIMDRERDRMKHPGRVIVRASSIAPLRLIAIVIGAAALMTVERTGTAAAVLLGLYLAALAASYALRDRRSAATDRILLLKYGVFTLALIGLPAALSPRGLLSAAAAFLIACIYEWWHDPESPVLSFGGSR